MTTLFSNSRIMLYSAAFIALCGALIVFALYTDTTNAQSRVVRDGSLIRLQGTSAVYAVQIDYIYTYRRYIPTYLLSAAERSNVVSLSARSFYNYTESNLAIEVTNQGNIVDGKVYMIERTVINGVARAYKRHLDMTPEQFTAAGFRWNAIFPVTSTELYNPYYILGTPLTAYNFGTASVVRRTPTPPRTSVPPTPTRRVLPTPPTQGVRSTPPVTPQGGAASTGAGASQSATASSQTLYYTSSHPRARYYYPADCSRWREISPSNLVSFTSVEALLAEYDRSPHSSC